MHHCVASSVCLQLRSRPRPDRGGRAMVARCLRRRQIVAHDRLCCDQRNCSSLPPHFETSDRARPTALPPHSIPPFRVILSPFKNPGGAAGDEVDAAIKVSPRAVAEWTLSERGRRTVAGGSVDGVPHSAGIVLPRLPHPSPCGGVAPRLVVCCRSCWWLLSKKGPLGKIIRHSAIASPSSTQSHLQPRSRPRP